MKVIDHLKAAKSTLFSIEILPPLKGKSIQSIYEGIDPLMEFKPSFVDVTYHREEYVYKKRDGGYLEKVSIRKRPGTVGICAAIMNRYHVDAVPHIICGGFTKEETESALTRYARELDRRDALRRARAQSAEAARIARLRYQAGRDSFQVVLDAERSLASVEAELARSESQLSDYSVSLFLALGGGWQA